MKTLLFYGWILLGPLSLAGQGSGFHYQATARDAAGQFLANQRIQIRFALRQGSGNGPVLYQERHTNVPTDAVGTFVVIVGEGALEQGNFNQIPWMEGEVFLNVEINGVAVASNRLQGVPFAKVATEMDLQDLRNVGGNPPAEDQVLTWNGNQWVPATPDPGTAFTAGAGINIAGEVISNTAPDQTVVLNGAGATTVTGTYPNFTITSTDAVDDADADPENELQNLTLNGNALSISGGNTVNLPTVQGGNYTAGAGINIAGEVISNTAPDQTVVLNGAGATTVTGTYPNFTIRSTDAVDDADADPENELQNLTLNGNALSISGGNTVNLPTVQGGNYTAGAGINIAGEVISNTAPDQTVVLSGAGATTVTGTYPSFTIRSTDAVDDADADPENELQNLTLNGNALSISGGNTVNLPTVQGGNYTAGAGINIAGEVISNTAPDQTVVLNGAGATTVTGTYPSFTIRSTDAVDDADADPENELQNLSLNGNALSISGGNTVNLPTVQGGNYTAGAGINIAGEVISNTAPDQTVVLNGAGATTVTGTYPNFTIRSTDAVDDADADPTNEIQDLTLNGSELSISGGSTVTLPIIGAAGASGINYVFLGSDGQGSRPEFDNVPATFLQHLGEISITVPGPGEVALFMTGDAFLTQAGYATLIYGWDDERVSTGTNFDYGAGSVTVNSPVGGTFIYSTMSLIRVVPVAAAGTYTFYAKGQSYAPSSNVPISIGHLMMVAQYFPNKY